MKCEKSVCDDEKHENRQAAATLWRKKKMGWEKMWKKLEQSKRKTFQTCGRESKNKITQTKKNYVFFKVVSKWEKILITKKHTR